MSTGSQPTAPLGASCSTSASHTSSSTSAKERMQETVAGLGDQAQRMQHDAMQAAQQQMEEAREKAMLYYAQGREKAAEMQQQVEEYVRREPTKALLAAAGIGFAVGLLMIRR